MPRSRSGAPDHFVRVKVRNRGPITVTAATHHPALAAAIQMPHQTQASPK